MDAEFKKISGISLIVGSILMVATMILHPSGGNIEHILKIKTIIIVSHSLAILSLPFIAFGFWGLSTALLTKSKTSILSFIISCFGLFAAMIAATINGLTLPLFLSKIAPKNIDVDIINPITSYGRNINIPMDYILLIAFALSINIWSVLIILSEKFPKWIGYYGLLLILFGVFALFNKYNFIGLFGFRIVVFGIVGWIIVVAIKILLADKKHN
jgi:hypothetical protein